MRSYARLRRMLRVLSALLAVALAVTACAGGRPGPGSLDGAAAPEPPTSDYWVYVAAESADLLHRIRFGPSGAAVENTVVTGVMPDETDGPHGLRFSPDGRYLYMTTAHGLPTGMLWRIEAGPDTIVGEPIVLGRFPATLDVTPDGLYAFVGNFNLHGAPVPSTVSAVYLPQLVEVAQIATCETPHGLRVSPDGTAAYSACVRDDRVVEMDTRTYRVTRELSVASGLERPLEEASPERRAGDAAPTCSPTWTQPSVDGRHLYVACNASDEILEVSVDDWRVTRRWQTGRGPYNLTVSRGGRLLLATLRPGAGVQAVDLVAGEIGPAVPTSGPLAHGVVVSPDSRYAFVSVEDIGMTPGKVDVYALPDLVRVASVEVGQQAGGIAFWRMEPAR